MKTPLGMEVDLGAGHIVLDGFPALRERGTAPPPLLGPCLLWPRSPISSELLFQIISERGVARQSLVLILAAAAVVTGSLAGSASRRYLIYSGRF